MMEIKEIVEDIWEELEGAEHYAMKAIKEKGMDTNAMNKYAEMSRQELAHVDNLHKMAVDMINKHKAAGHEAPAAMQAVWDWEHDKMMRRAAKIRAMLDMAK